MIQRIVEFFRPYMADYGYLIVFSATLLENSVALGLIVPGETLVLIAAFYSAIGRLDPVWVAVFAAVGGIIGDNLGYAIGRKAGERFLVHHGRWFLLSPDRLEKARDFYRHHGGKTVFLGRFVPVMRSVGCLVAGVGSMRYRKFLAWDSAGAILWAVGHTLLGYYAGRSYTEVERYLGPTGLLVLAILVVLIGVSVFIAHRRRKRRREEAAAGEEEAPTEEGALPT